jgi:hypothetical protein
VSEIITVTPWYDAGQVVLSVKNRKCWKEVEEKEEEEEGGKEEDRLKEEDLFWERSLSK